MTPDRLEHLVKTAARRYARRCWWAELDDLTQEARLASLAAEVTFDNRVGVDFERYVWRAMVLALRRYLWTNTAPVSGGMHRPERDRRDLRVRRLGGSAADGGREDDDGGARGPGRTLVLVDTKPAADDALDRAEWCDRVQRRLAALAGDVGPMLDLLAADGGRLAGPGAREAAILRRAAGADAGLYNLMRARKEALRWQP